MTEIMSCSISGCRMNSGGSCSLCGLGMKHYVDVSWAVAERDTEIERLREEVRHLRIENARLRDEAFLRRFAALTHADGKTP